MIEKRTNPDPALELLCLLNADTERGAKLDHLANDLGYASQKPVRHLCQQIAHAGIRVHITRSSEGGFSAHIDPEDWPKAKELGEAYLAGTVDELDPVTA